ncbi:glycerol kinase [Thermoflexales bacterium]|nr:glycerol kinase [Thermoflexales bacterium]
MKYLLGLDQGTSGTKAYLMDFAGNRAGLGYVPTELLRLRPDWIEQDPRAVAAGAAQAIELALRAAHGTPSDIAAVGIASQRGTDFIWDARTGQPIVNAITWQDLRTLPLIEEIDQWEHAGQRRYRLGYFPGPWCASMHLAWRARHQPEFQAALRDDQLRIGMSASWLITALGKPSQHLHDYSLTQKTGLWDFRHSVYWAEWIDRLQLSPIGLPDPAPTFYDYGTLHIGDGSRQAHVPVVAMIGDQQAALFGHGCRQAGQAECTHGTASFVNIVAGGAPPELDNINVYYAWSLPSDASNLQRATSSLQHTYCLEADTTVTGAAVRWMVQRGHWFESEAQLDALAESVADAGGVIVVPAFTGLNVPYNDHDARATILGLALGSDRAHVARAFLDSIGYQLRAILETIHDRTGLHVEQLSVGGGLSNSDIACQIQADRLGIPLVRPNEKETTARGAALLAGLGLGVWKSLDDLPPLPTGSTFFEPRLTADRRDSEYARWQHAVRHVRELSENR